jgi:hypothetical protein
MGDDKTIKDCIARYADNQAKKELVGGEKQKDLLKFSIFWEELVEKLLKVLKLSFTKNTSGLPSGLALSQSFSEPLLISSR